MVEKDGRVMGEDDFRIHLGRALERYLIDMTVKCKLKIKFVNGWPR